ncbi:MAG: type 4a pilus biogenesis protein PilO [Deltaproteobacteria bacterium]|nr:type 4a pilus biogenesis protein PilO [Deltaproteobacteria bacterium]
MAKLSLPSIPFEKIAALNRAYRILICAAVFLSMGAGFYYLLYKPQLEKLTDLKQKYAGLQTKLAGARAAAANLEDFQKEYDKAQLDFKIALRLLPDKKEIPTLLESVSKSGTDSGLEVLLFQPKSEELADFYAKIPVAVEVRGGFHNLAMFFDRIGKLPRIVNVPVFNIEIPRRGRPANLSAVCTAETYRFLDASEAKKDDKESKKKKKKKG